MRELRARKAKFGFQSSITESTFLEIAEALQLAREIDPLATFDISGYTTPQQATIYTNNEACANAIREKIAVANSV
jgi:hypothetical protein